MIDEGFGWYGAFAIVLAFALSNFDLIVVKGLAYQILNLTGAIGILYVSVKKQNYQPAVLNALWAVIALGAIVRSLR